MKAAVIYHKVEIPQYTDFPEPVAKTENELLVSVRAVAIKHFDKGRAAGKHYSANAVKETGRVIGGDGVCLLSDGSRVYGMGSWSKEQVRKLFTEILPEMFQLAADGLLNVETIEVKLKDIAELWNLEVPNGRRLVVTI